MWPRLVVTSPCLLGRSHDCALCLVCVCVGGGGASHVRHEAILCSNSDTCPFNN